MRGGASPANSVVPKSQELSAPFELRGCGRVAPKSQIHICADSKHTIFALFFLA